MEPESSKQSLRQSKRISTPYKQIHEKPIVLNKLARSNQNFETSPAIKRKKKNELDDTDIVCETVLGNYEIEFIDETHSGDVDDTQQIYQVDAEIEFVDDDQFTMGNENVDKSESENEKKPLKNMKSAGKRQMSSRKRNKAATVVKTENAPLQTTDKDVTNEVNDDYYFKTVDDVSDLDENGEKKIFKCALCDEKFVRRQGS